MQSTPHYPLTWSWKKGDTLSPSELYHILALRQEIFVVEQHCIYLDADGLDFDAYHLLGHDQDQNLIAYLRVYQPLSELDSELDGTTRTVSSLDTWKIG